MRSSRAESLARIEALYEEARAALRADDVGGVRARLAAVEPLLAPLRGEIAAGPAPAGSPLARAREAHGGLMAELAARHADTGQAIGAHRRGRRLLAAYGRRHATAGTRLEHEG